VNWSAMLVALVPFGPVTVTSTIAEPAGEARNTQARYNVCPTSPTPVPIHLLFFRLF
jgi:hypothetical protein